MENRLSQTFVVPCYDTDSRCRLKPSSFMDFAQEIANVHADVLGFGYDDLQKTRTVWVLSRMHLHFNRYPMWREEVKLTTWHKGAEGLFYLRDFLMTGSGGETLVAATTSWVVLNIDTRRISRDSEVLDNGTACHDNALEHSCDKVRIPAGANAEKVGEHKVSYSDVDMNGHTNNARYIVWALDALGYDFAVNNPVKDLKINFNNETRPGDTVELYRAEAGGRIYIEGRCGGKSAFCVEME